MEKNIWRIINKTNQTVKVSVSTGSNSSRGVILPPGHYCLGVENMTSYLDMQHKRGLVDIEKYGNEVLNLKLGEPYKLSEVELAKYQTSKFIQR